MNHHLRRILVPLLIVLTFLSVLHLFVYFIAARSLDGIPRVILGFCLAFGVILAPTGMLLGMSPLKKKTFPITFASYVWLGSFCILFSFSVIEAILALFWGHDHSEWVLIAGALASLWALKNGLSAPKLITHEISGSQAMRGTSLVQISDVHIGMPFLNQKWLQSVVDRINALEPDIIAITGDLADGAYEDVSPQLHPLQSMRARDGKFYVTGNHEYIRGGQWEHRLRELGFSTLHNNHHVVTREAGSVLIAGVPDRMVKRFHQDLHSNPDAALKTEKSVDYKILLAHEPASVMDLKSESCDLILSGHTHGGQIFPFGLLVRLAQPVVAGFKTIRGIQVFAHQGTGLWGPPMRWLTRSEIVVFRWT